MKKEFDPNAAAGADAGVFGLPYSVDESKLVLLPVPWEATTSYGGGTSEGPAAIFDASKQVDLFDLDMGNFFEAGIAWAGESEDVRAWNKKAKSAAAAVIRAGGVGDNADLRAAAKEVNELGSLMNKYVYSTTKKYLEAGKIVGLVGGDHSTPMGAMEAYLEEFPNMGVLHFDAHADMRKAYEGFEDSHASIMYNVLTRTKLEKLVQVGIRDLCEEESEFIRSQSGRVATFFDRKMAAEKFNGANWDQLCQHIIAPLPNEVYISFDIDGLDPRYCPHTGTPVPGGLEFQEALYLLGSVVKSGRKIVGFDLNEVAPGPEGDEWDANVGARLLYYLCGLALS